MSFHIDNELIETNGNITFLWQDAVRNVAYEARLANDLVAGDISMRRGLEMSDFVASRTLGRFDQRERKFSKS
jgi:hypothetical protein